MAVLKSGTFYIVAAAVVLIAAAVWFISGGTDSREVVEGRELRSRTIAATKAAERKARDARLRDRKRTRKDAVAVKPEPVKPNFISDVSEEMKLTEEMKRMFLDLQAALDMDDAKKVYALVHKLQLMDEWPDGIPRSVKLKALQALSWFGAAGMAEAVGFLADSDPEIQQTAMDTFQQQFDDAWDLGDYKLAETMKAVVKVVTDADRLESYYDQFMNMRDIVKADLALAIYDSGNEAAVNVLKKNLDVIFNADDYEIVDRSGVERFKKEAEQIYRDDPARKQEDDDMYGPTDWNW